MSWLFTSGDRSIGASASVLPMNSQGWFSLGLTGLISLQSKGLSRIFSSTTTPKHRFSALSCLYGFSLTSVHDYQKTIALTIWTFVRKVMSLLFNTLSRFAIAFLLRGKLLLISRLHSLSTVILQPKGLSRVFSSTTIKSISSLELSLFYGPTVTSVHDYWKNHSFDYMDLGWQSNVSAFQHAV